MLRMIRDRGLNMQWKAAGVPIFKMDEETFELMAATGCQMIGVAIESGNQRILKEVIKKPVDLEKVPGLIAAAKSYGIFVVANFIIGFPGETWSEIRNTLYFAESCTQLLVIKLFNKSPHCDKCDCQMSTNSKHHFSHLLYFTGNIAKSAISVIKPRCYYISLNIM